MSGMMGVVAQRDCREDLFFGTDYHSHLGTQFAGMAVFSATLKRKIHDISAGQFKSKFYEDYAKFSGPMGVGVISGSDEQPVYVNSKFGPLAVVMDGNIDNVQALVRELYAKGHSFSEVTDGGINQAELASKVIVNGATIVEGIQNLFSRITGACSLLVLAGDGIYAARDRRGYSSLVIGSKGGSTAIASEASAFPNLGYAITRYLDPGEIILIRKPGRIEVKSKGRPINQICSFLWIYTGFPASSYEGINAELVRERSGEILARSDSVTADLAAGIPDSGTAHAIGYAMGAGIPYRRVLIKYTPGYGRSYTPPSQEVRDLVARMKLIPVRDIIKGKRIVICDDSIVRGTQLKNYTIQKLKESGAKEIHLRIACPPLMFPCKFGCSTRSVNELAARKAIRALEGKDLKDVRDYIDEHSKKHCRMVEWIRKELGATSLKYQKLDDMIEAIGRPKEKICLYCWTGKEP